MKQIILAAAIALLAGSSAMAQDATCASKAVGSDGKPLAGAAKTSFLAKCKREACESKAMDKNGKPLAGAAKNSFMKKCESEA
jgi:opacity protein-like surface antigen